MSELSEQEQPAREIYGQRVELLVEQESEYDVGWKKAFTGTIVERPDYWRDGQRRGVFIQLDRGGFLGLRSTQEESPADWSELLIEAIERVVAMPVEQDEIAAELQLGTSQREADVDPEWQRFVAREKLDKRGGR